VEGRPLIRDLMPFESDRGEQPESPLHDYSACREMPTVVPNGALGAGAVWMRSPQGRATSTNALLTHAPRGDP